MNCCGIGRMKIVFFVEDNRKKFEKTWFFQTFSLLVPRNETTTIYLCNRLKFNIIDNESILQF